MKTEALRTHASERPTSDHLMYIRINTFLAAASGASHIFPSMFDPAELCRGGPYVCITPIV